MKPLKDYYNGQLSILKPSLNDSIKITIGSKKTNFLDLNKDSLKAIQDYFNNIKL